jgi:hypothetical protein
MDHRITVRFEQEFWIGVEEDAPPQRGADCSKVDSTITELNTVASQW